MKKTTTKTQLRLARETILQLSTIQLGNVQGGVSVVGTGCETRGPGCEPSGIIACETRDCA